MRHRWLKHFYRDTSRHFWATAFSFLLIAIYAAIGLNLTFVSPFVEALKDFEMTDVCYKVMSEEQSHAITIVDLTDLYSRADIAATLHQIEAMQPKVIGVDAVFEGEKDDTLGNAMIKEVARMYDNIVYSCKIKEEITGGERLTSSFFTDSIPVPQGVTNMPRSLYGGVKRTLIHHWKCGDEELPSLIDRMMEVLGETPKQEAVTRINFSPTRFTVLQPNEVLTSPDLIEGRIVFLGAMADEVDMHYTPLGKMAGVELLAYAAQTLIEEKAIWRLPWLLQILLTVSIVVMTEWMRDRYLQWTSRHKNAIIRFFLGSNYVISIWIFSWITLLMWMVILCFAQWNLAIDIGWSVSGIAMLSMGRDLRNAINGFVLEKKAQRIERKKQKDENEKQQ